MKKDWKSLPPALQHQMIIQIGLALFCLVLAIGALAFVSFTVSIPFPLGRRCWSSVQCVSSVLGCGDSILFSEVLS